MTDAKRTLVLGAGHNGLAAAIHLARAGRKVVVLERRATAGGVAALEEFAPGYSVPGIQHGTFGLRRRVVEQLGLAGHGLQLRERAAAVCVPEAEGAGLVLRPGDDAIPEGLAERSPSDALAWESWRAELKPVRGLVEALIDEAPPELEGAGWSTLWKLAKPGLALRMLGAHAMSRLLRSAPMCAEDLLADTFSDSLLRAALASRGVEGAFLGPRSAGSGALLLLRELAGGPGARGGVGAFTDALVSAARAAGVEVRYETEVTGLLLDGSRLRAVRTHTGEELECEQVVSGLGVRSTFAACEGVAPVRQLRAAQRVRARGTTSAIRLALSSPLRFRSHEEEAFEFARIVGTTTDIERAFDQSKYGAFSDAPWLDLCVPSEADPSLAPAGHASVSILLHHTPHDLLGGWTEERKAELLGIVLARLEPLAVDLSQNLVASQVLAPTDLAERFGLDGGHPMHAELGLDQLWVQRPSVHLARYRSGVEGLLLGGRSTHPGGEFLGSSGLLAAQAALEQR